MNDNLEFVRGNQKSFIRLPLDEQDTEGYELAMCFHNSIKSILPFQRRMYNGQEYLYFDVAGTQSLDILLEMQKLSRPVMRILARSMVQLCCHISEYMLSLESIVLEPKYMMYKSFEGEIQFVYAFQRKSDFLESVERLLEYCIDHLDYEDNLLTEVVFRLYENLQEQRERFSLQEEMERLLSRLEETLVEEADLAPDKLETANVEMQQQEMAPLREAHLLHSYKKWKRYLVCFVIMAIAGIFIWKPLTLLKVFFFASTGVFLVGMFCYITYLEKRKQDCEKREKSAQDIAYIREYENIILQSTAIEDGTQFIAIDSITGMLYNLQGMAPQYIPITETAQLIGKDKSKVQVCIQSDCISRVHARIQKCGENYILEDLCSTNGTWVNGKSIEPRVQYILKEGDKVSFASCEYIFR